jgi:AcrR family transcriptional regulator
MVAEPLSDELTRSGARRPGPQAREAATLDGRVLRGQRNRQAIVDALLSLYREGTSDPTAAQIAERAGVSTRSVFAHFEDREALVEAVSAEMAPVLHRLVDPEPPSPVLGDRIMWLAGLRAEYFEAAQPVIKAALRYVDEQPAIAERMYQDGLVLREQVERVFAPELAPRCGADGRCLLEALDVTFSYEVWRRMRTSHRMGVTAAKGIVVHMAHSLLR